MIPAFLLLVELSLFHWLGPMPCCPTGVLLLDAASCPVTASDCEPQLPTTAELPHILTICPTYPAHPTGNSGRLSCSTQQVPIRLPLLIEPRPRDLRARHQICSRKPPGIGGPEPRQAPNGVHGPLPRQPSPSSRLERRHPTRRAQRSLGEC
jgi:hypothetical protein